MKIVIPLVLVVLVLFVLIPLVMVWWLGRETFRDVVLIAWGTISILAFVFLIGWIIALWQGINGVIRQVKVVMNEDVRPILATSQESASNVTGTTRFLGDTVVSPIIRVYGVVSGVRRGVSVFTGLTGRGRKKKA